MMAKTPDEIAEAKANSQSEAEDTLTTLYNFVDKMEESSIF